ncbi:MAG: hypothetical protein QME61_00545 [Patescibacteria group bacterium]|nr:hypothetical protein [Patescibacteria group bacterium]
MQNAKLQFKIQNFRKRHPKFIYENYSYKILDNNFEIFFNFKIEPNIYFRPKVVIENIDESLIKKIGDRVLNNLVFHLGLMEIPSYWKATCSPEIIIEAGSLNKEQIRWWKDLIIKGMGQFFYENKINFQKPNFLKIKTLHFNAIALKCRIEEFLNRNGILVPIGGGKDSVVTLEAFKKAKKQINCFSLNPTGAAQRIMKIAGCKKPIIVRRRIDKKLLELNQKGFLNGHTPFSAYLAFLSILTAAIFNYKYIAFSNERSSNEGNVKYLGKIINHQWSKSFNFEKKFRNYSKKYLIPEIEYFSFLRPLYEIQIAKLFSKYPKYFSAFLSCNEAYKTASGTKKPIEKWCKNCPKCLFIFATLYPFIETKKVIKIFGENLFEKRKLLPIMKELIGEKKFKPLECVGTKKENLIAFYLSLKKLKKYPGGEKFKFPFLLEYFENRILPKYQNLEKESEKLLKSWNDKNHIPKTLIKIIRNWY